MPIGALSDRTAPRCRGLLGRRRPYVIAGQLLTVGSLVLMHPAVARSYWVLTAGYTLFMLANALSWAPCAPCAVRTMIPAPGI